MPMMIKKNSSAGDGLESNRKSSPPGSPIKITIHKQVTL
jgi:hypothetical protein